MPSTEETLQQAWQIHQRGNAAQAEKIYRDVLQREPNHANAWCYWGIAMHDLRRYDQAVKAYENAIRLQPNFPIAWNNMGNSLRYLGRVADADAAFQHALDQSPQYFNAWRNRGTLHAWTGRIDLAFEYYHQAMQLNPNDPELHRNLGVIHLLQGNFKEGWKEYRYRWQCAEAIPYRYQQPKWNGEPLDGKTILLYAEQGLGDTLHFVRFAELLTQKGARTILHVQPPLLAILQQCKGIGEIIPNSLQVETPFDYHCSLIDVADILGIDASNIPSQVPYLFAKPNLISYWEKGLQQTLPASRFRIGLNWQGNPDHQADMFRSFPLKAMECLAELDEVQLISLQKGPGTEQIQQWQGEKILYCLPAEVDQSSGAFMDTAAILHSLDYVVTSDTSLAHLAGGMGIKTCLVLGFTPDWRWLQYRSDSPWYPSLRLFRQTTIGQWDSILHEVAEFLRGELAQQPAD